MIEVRRNPPNVAASYLANLNTCFPGWGSMVNFRWAFEREVGGPAADLMVLSDNGEVLAGSAVTYRTIRTESGGLGLVGIMTGSWTLPAARGRGCFTQIIDDSRAFVRERGGVALLAYVTESNASYRRLAAAGSTLFPTRYVVGRSEASSADAAPVRVFRPEASDAGRWAALFESRRSAGCTFHYDAEGWASQFLQRPTEPELVDIGSLGFCVIERHGEVVRLQAICPTTPVDFAPLVGAVAAWAGAQSKKVFFFASSPKLALEIPGSALTITEGFLTALVADEERCASLLGSGTTLEALAPWSIHSGDRM